MIIETCIGSKAAFCVERAQSGAYRVRRLDVLADDIGEDEVVVFRHRDVAVAYGQASAALDRYLTALDEVSDSEAAFEEWVRLDEIFELKAMAMKDAPSGAPKSIRLN